MKKLCIVFVAMVVGMLTTACSKDMDHAYVEITTSTGDAYIAVSFHGNNSEYERRRMRMAMSDSNAVKVNVKDGETAKIHFHCDQCGYDEVIEEATAPVARLFSCNCDGTFKDGNMKEYIAVLIGNNPEFEGTQE